MLTSILIVLSLIPLASTKPSGQQELQQGPGRQIDQWAVDDRRPHEGGNRSEALHHNSTRNSSRSGDWDWNGWHNRTANHSGNGGNGRGQEWGGEGNRPHDNDGLKNTGTPPTRPSMMSRAVTRPAILQSQVQQRVGGQNGPGNGPSGIGNSVAAGVSGRKRF